MKWTGCDRLHTVLSNPADGLRWTKSHNYISSGRQLMLTLYMLKHVSRLLQEVPSAGFNCLEYRPNMIVLNIHTVYKKEEEKPEVCCSVRSLKRLFTIASHVLPLFLFYLHLRSSVRVEKIEGKHKSSSGWQDWCDDEDTQQGQQQSQSNPLPFPPEWSPGQSQVLRTYLAPASRRNGRPSNVITVIYLLLYPPVCVFVAARRQTAAA